MRFSKLGALILLLGILLSLNLSAVAQPDDLTKKLDAYLAARTELGRFSGAVLIVKGGKIILRKGYGYADMKKKVPFTPETQHAVASISKMFTAMAVLKLREQGKLRLEDSICNYLDDCPPTWQPITLLHLIRHTSGIPDYEEMLDLGSDKYLEFMRQPDASLQIIALAKKQPLQFTPGEKFRYCNTGYVLLSAIIQRVSGQSFESFVAKTLLQPAGMTHSNFFSAEYEPKHLASGYTHGDLGWAKNLAGFSLTEGLLTKLPHLPPRQMAGQGGLYSTLDDLYRWSQLMDGSRLITEKVATEVYTPGLNGYGYGWFIDKAFGHRRFRHNGILPGYVSNFVKFPDEQLTLIIFSNLDRVRLTNITRDLTAIVMGNPYDLPVRGTVVTLNQTEIARLEGEYKMTDGSRVTIRKEPDYLIAEQTGQFIAGLIPLSATEFYFPLVDGKVTFTLDASGKVVRMNMRYSGEDHIAERLHP